MNSPGRKALRTGRRSIPGHFYHITIVTRRRHPFFQEFRCACAACRMFSSPAVNAHCTTQSFVVMPDHVHWLLQLHGDLSIAVKLYKSRVSMAVGIPTWEDGFHDHALRQDEDIRRIARYIVANPLRAGLVKRVGDYPYWDAVWL
ncbi:REP element-mobilizing transposase RayT [Halomonas campaniensis]|uniref:REP element-mobilizing transposase RayT n=1 Tax=Halomonas campaniensis TaxID=213554 RepID=A0A7W5K311_9GAMM|nr:transposase [Halomonas campaniensis]MBB3331019.1 REP element-mobilizing transposase RayT [Halomonas campaniensis]